MYRNIVQGFADNKNHILNYNDNALCGSKVVLWITGTSAEEPKNFCSFCRKLYRREVPTTSTNFNFVDYGIKNKLVYLIEVNEKGNRFYIQYGGVSCSSYINKGFISKVCMIENEKYLQTKYWDNFNIWLLNENLIPNKIVDVTKSPSWKIYSKNNPYKDLSSEELIKKIEEESKIYYESIRHLYIDAGIVLDEILEHCSDRMEIKLEKSEKKYGVDWSEAFIPLTIDNKEFILTWYNSD